MKKYFCLLFVVFSMVIVSSCSSSSDEDIEIDVPKVKYSVCLHNDIDVSQINKKKFNGDVLELYLVTAPNGKFYSVTPELLNKSKITYTFPDDYEGEQFFTVFKLGGTEKEFFSLEFGASKKIMLFTPKQNSVIDVYFTEDSKYSMFQYTRIDELKSVIMSLVKD